MGHIQLFLLGLVAAGLAAAWYDDRIASEQHPDVRAQSALSADVTATR